MPNVPLSPGSGASVVASAQVAQSRVFVVRELDDSSAFYTLWTFPVVSNLPRLFVHAFLYPSFDRGDEIFKARTTLEWRIVYRMAGDWGWVPFSAPMVLPVGVPVRAPVRTAGVEQIAVQVRVGPGTLSPDQGEDRVRFSISASQ